MIHRKVMCISVGDLTGLLYITLKNDKYLLFIYVIWLFRIYLIGWLGECRILLFRLLRFNWLAMILGKYLKLENRVDKI